MVGVDEEIVPGRVAMSICYKTLAYMIKNYGCKSLYVDIGDCSTDLGAGHEFRSVSHRTGQDGYT